MPIPIISTCPKRDKLHEVADRIHKQHARSQVNAKKEDFFFYASKYGFFQIQQGQVPETERENARQFLKKCWGQLRELGHDPETMFSDEAIHALLDYEWGQSRKRLDRRDRAFAKLRRYHEQYGFSALKNSTKIVGRSFVPCLEWVDASVFPPTEADKRRITETKSEMLDRVLAGMGVLSDWDWVKGDEYAQTDTNLEEFLEIARLALWLEFDSSTHFYSQKAIEAHGSSLCREQPGKDDDTRQVSLDFRLYSSFVMDEEVRDGYFCSYIGFRAWKVEKF